MDLKEELTKLLKSCNELQKQSIEVGENLNKIEQVASISANNDNAIGSLIAEAMAKVKKGCYYS